MKINIVKWVFALAVLPQSASATSYVWRNVEPGCVPRVKVEYNSSNEGISTHTDILSLAQRWNGSNFYYDNSAANSSGTIFIAWDPAQFPGDAVNAVGITVPYEDTNFLHTDLDGDGVNEEYACPSSQNIYLRDVAGMPWESCDSGFSNGMINFNWVVMHELGHAMLTGHDDNHLTYPDVMGVQPPGSTQSDIMTHDDSIVLTANDIAYRDNRYTATGYCQTRDDHCLCYLDDPIADVSNVRCDANGVWSWNATQQNETRGYLIQELMEINQWRSVHWEPKHDLPRYEVTAPADNDAVYRILDVANNGSRTMIWRGSARSYGLAQAGDIASAITHAEIAEENQRLYEAILAEQKRTGRTSLGPVTK